MESNNKTLMIGGLVAIVLVVGGVIAFMGGDSEDDTADNTNETTTSQTEVQESTPSAEEEAPVAESTIVELAQATDSLSTLVAAVVEADLVETLNSEGPFTVFAPTNDAFANLLAELDVTTEELLARDDLADILTYHVVSGEVLSSDLSDGQVVETVQGGELTVSITDAGVMLTDANGNEANITAVDIDASNGVVHLIDAVVLP
jgi:uncharacterized surface protein with fasciclin (FAS1) repeats